MVLPIVRIVNPRVQITGVSVNTKALGNAEAEACLKEIEDRMSLPAVDPYRHGAAKLVDALAEI